MPTLVTHPASPRNPQLSPLQVRWPCVGDLTRVLQLERGAYCHSTRAPLPSRFRVCLHFCTLASRALLLQLLVVSYARSVLRVNGLVIPVRELHVCSAYVRSAYVRLLLAIRSISEGVSGE